MVDIALQNTRVGLGWEGGDSDGKSGGQLGVRVPDVGQRWTVFFPVRSGGDGVR